MTLQGSTSASASNLQKSLMCKEILLTLQLSTLAVFQGSDEPCRVITKVWTIVTVTPNVGKPMSQIDGDDH